MGFLDKLQEGLERTIGPIAQKISHNKTITAISSGVIMTMPVTVGAGIISLLGNMPIPAFTTFMENIGFKQFIDQNNTIGNYIGPLMNVFLIAYIYAKNEDENPIASGLFAWCVYFNFMIPVLDSGGEQLQGIPAQFLAGDGVFASLIIAILVAKAYCFIMKKNLRIKMPESVPPMIAKSFEPMLSGIIIFGVCLLLKFGIYQTPYQDLFTMINSFVTAPVTALGANVTAIIVVFTLVNLFWFFGIHPLALVSIFTPVISQMVTTSVQTMMAGETIAYAKELSVQLAMQVGGTGGTLGLIFILAFFAKSERYKSITKISFIPAICNINEPLIFGLPIMMNPLLFIPMVLNPVISGLIMVGAYDLGFITNYNPIGQVSLPWTSPTPLIGFFAGGVPMLVTILVITVVSALLYFPFFMIMERKERAAEKING